MGLGSSKASPNPNLASSQAATVRAALYGLGLALLQTQVTPNPKPSPNPKPKPHPKPKPNPKPEPNLIPNPNLTLT